MIAIIMQAQIQNNSSSNHANKFEQLGTIFYPPQMNSELRAAHQALSTGNNGWIMILNVSWMKLTIN